MSSSSDQSSSKLRETAKKWKYGIIKAIDVSGLTFLTPIVRLISGEEPLVQVKQIFRFIVVPVFAVVIFIVGWNILAPMHTTKSGEVPTPGVVWKASKSIWTFHTREKYKEAAYETTGERRERLLQVVDKRLTQLKPLEEKVKAEVSQVRKEADERTDKAVEPVMKEYEDLKAEFEESDREREQELLAKASSLDVSDEAARDSYVKEVQAHLETVESQEEELGKIRERADEIRSKKDPELEAVIDRQTELAELRQYLGKMSQLLGSSNKEVKLNQAKARLEVIEADFAKLEDESEILAAAQKIAKNSDRIQKFAEADYAKPQTLPDQIKRSILCVFCGFMLGTLIAVPIGILCGLSSTFMAAVTPFIALFKPVSPIVWLPIALIIVGGFIPDPDKHWLIEWLKDAPLIGWAKINPAFMACAITVALCSLWATMVNTAFGVASIDPDHLNVARVLRLGFKDRLFKIIIPSALPLIFAGMRISLGVGWMVLIAAELLSSSEGIGKFVWDAFSNGAPDSFAKMFVVVFAVGIVGLILDRIMIVLQRLVSFDGAPTSV